MKKVYIILSAIVLAILLGTSLPAGNPEQVAALNWNGCPSNQNCTNVNWSS